MMWGVCVRAGKLSKQLEKDKMRMIRRMETFEQDRILEDIHTIWEEIYPHWGGNTGESLPGAFRPSLNEKLGVGDIWRNSIHHQND